MADVVHDWKLWCQNYPGLYNYFYCYTITFSKSEYCSSYLEIYEHVIDFYTCSQKTGDQSILQEYLDASLEGIRPLWIRQGYV